MRVAVSSNPHASPSRLSASAFFLTHANTQTTEAKRWPARTRAFARTVMLWHTYTAKYALQSHIEILGFVQGINKPFQATTGRG